MNELDALFGDDQEHPIPCLSCIDIYGVGKGGGA